MERNKYSLGGATEFLSKSIGFSVIILRISVKILFSGTGFGAGNGSLDKRDKQMYVIINNTTQAILKLNCSCLKVYYTQVYARHLTSNNVEEHISSLIDEF